MWVPLRSMLRLLVLVLSIAGETQRGRDALLGFWIIESSLELSCELLCEAHSDRFQNLAPK